MRKSKNNRGNKRTNKPNDWLETVLSSSKKTTQAKPIQDVVVNRIRKTDTISTVNIEEVWSDIDQSDIKTNRLMQVLGHTRRMLSSLLSTLKGRSHKIFLRLKSKYFASTGRRFAALAVTITIFLISLVVIFTSGDAQQTYKEQAGQALPKAFVEEASQDVYYPSQLPENYRISTTESINEDVLVAYTITNSFESLTLSQQSNIPFEAFERLFIGADVTEYSSGDVYIKNSPEGYTAGVRFDETSVLLTAPSTVSVEVIQAILSGLKKQD